MTPGPQAISAGSKCQSQKRIEDKNNPNLTLAYILIA